MAPTQSTFPEAPSWGADGDTPRQREAMCEDGVDGWFLASDISAGECDLHYLYSGKDPNR